MLSRRDRFWPLVGLLALLPSAGLQAETPELIFSEYVEGRSLNKALEIYNGTGANVDLAAYRVETYFNGSSTPGVTLPLAGRLAPGAVFVLAHEQAAAAILGAADLTQGGSWFNGNDAVVLRKGTTVVDVIGQVGIDPGAGRRTGPISTRDHTLRRRPAVASGDTDPSDPFDPRAEWEGFAVDTVDGLGVHDPRAGPIVVATTPAAEATGVAADAPLAIRFDRAVTATCGWFALHCSTSGAHTATVTGGPEGFTLIPVPPFAAGERCTVTVFGARSRSRRTARPWRVTWSGTLPSPASAKTPASTPTMPRSRV